jgi:multidrug transporter EmrE-like cation transporter
MKEKLLSYSFIFLTIAFTVYGQIMMKWRVSTFGALPTDSGGKMHYFGRALTDPGILSGLFAGFLAAMCWMAAMTKFPLSFAYPFMALNFVIVVLVSRFAFNESISYARALGVALIVLGTFFVSRS